MNQSLDENQAKEASKGAGKLRLKALALALYILCPLGAYFAWQDSMVIFGALFLFLIGLAFVLTMVSG